MWAICELLQTNGYSIPSYGIKLRQRVAHQLLWGIIFHAAPRPVPALRLAAWSMVGKRQPVLRDWSRVAKDTLPQQPGDLLNPKRRLLRPNK